MKTDQPVPKTIDEYIATFPADVQAILETIRSRIRQAVPEAEETISYQMPTFKLHGLNMVYFAGHKKHIGLYPTPVGVAEFKDDLAGYETGKGSVKFPLDQPIPFELIDKIVAYLQTATEKRAAAKNKKN